VKDQGLAEMTLKGQEQAGTVEDTGVTAVEEMEIQGIHLVLLMVIFLSRRLRAQGAVTETICGVVGRVVVPYGLMSAVLLR
jgi:hypothetical protein